MMGTMSRGAVPADPVEQLRAVLQLLSPILSQAGMQAQLLELRDKLDELSTRERVVAAREAALQAREARISSALQALGEQL